MRLVPGMVVLSLLALCSCLPRAVVPLPTASFTNSSSPKTLLIYLPGLGDSMAVFQANGLVDSLRAYAPGVDLVVTNAHYGYYRNRALLDRLTLDVLVPAKRKGYTSFWLVGNSMGGLGSQLYAWKNPGLIRGIILLGPFVSKRKVVKEIEQAGGLASWHPVDVRESDWNRGIWLWRQRCVMGDSTCPQVYLAFGKNDRLSYGQELLMRTLPQGHALALEGGHDWPVWKQGFVQFLKEGILSRP